MVAGVAAMLVAAMLGSAMKLNNTAVVMSSCVVFVAVAMWADSALSRRRRESLTLLQAASLEQATSLEPPVSLEPVASLESSVSLEPSRETAAAPHQDITHHSSQEHASASASDHGASASEPSKREGNAA